MSKMVLVARKIESVMLVDSPKCRSERGSSNPAVTGPIRRLENCGSAKVVKTECWSLSKMRESGVQNVFWRVMLRHNRDRKRLRQSATLQFRQRHSAHGCPK